MSELHTGEVDGVPTFWVETGRPTLAASLVFRHGQADEELTTAGQTHLLEHLCLHGRGGGPLAVNGSVGLLSTDLTAHGPADLVAAHLRDVSAWLADPDLEAFDHERRILAAESSVRGTGGVAEALTWRYGARGPGLTGYGELGLGRTRPDDLRLLATRAFTADNAVLVLDGPPDGVRLELPRGERQPFRPATPCDDRRPARYPVPDGAVLSGEVERTSAATFLARWVGLELEDRLRHRAGAAYAPWMHYEPVDAHRAVVLAGSDVAPEHVRGLTRLLLDLVADLERGRGAEDRLRTAVAEFVQSVSDPYQAYGVAIRAGHFALRGEAPPSLEQTLDEAREVTVEQLVAHASQLASTLLVGLPAEAEPLSKLRPLTQDDPGPTGAGRRYRSANAPADRSVLVVAPDAVRVSGDGRPVGVRLDRVVGLLQVPDGARRIIDEDGWGVTVEPTLWRRGSDVVAQLDRMVPADLHLPQPARKPEDVPRPAPLRTRVVGDPATAYLLLMAALAAVAVPAVILLDLSVGPLAVLIGSAGFWWNRIRRERARTGG